jgi:hypothetical protein
MKIERAKVVREFYRPCEKEFGAVSMLAVSRKGKDYYIIIRDTYPFGTETSWVDEECFDLAQWHGPDEFEAEEQFRLEIDNIECWAVALDDSEGQL